MNFGPRELSLIGILMAVPLSSYWLVFRPQNLEIAEARREIEHKRSMLDKLREATSQNEDLERANADIRESIDAIEDRLPSTKEVDGMVRQVSNLAVESGLEPPVMDSAKPVTAAEYMEQPLEMSITGPFSGFYKFLLAMEQMPRITRTPDMNIKRAEDENGDMKAEFTLSIYFQQEDG